MEKVSITTHRGMGNTLAAHIHFPCGFDASRRYAVVVVSHPGGGVKEQTAGLYAQKLAESGVVALAFDASFQGESSGTPRQLENPHIRTEDISTVIDYLMTLSYVDTDKIGAMGICAGAGYTVNAAINDRRIKAIGTVSAVNIGQMFRNGWDGSAEEANALPLLEMAAAARRKEACSPEDERLPLAPMRKEDAPNKELEEAWEYYRTPRCKHPNAPSYMTTRSLSQLVSYDAYYKAEVFLTQPLQIVVGSEAGSKWMSDGLLARAASKDKQMYVVKGSNHMQLYDGQAQVAEAIAVLTPFFTRTLA